MTDSRVIVALDYPQKQQAMHLVNQLEPNQCHLKVGKEMFTHLGPDFVRELVDQGFDVFLDLKFYDIPNTVAAACDVAADLGVWMMNLHASGGRRMMEAAAERLANRQHRPMLIGVTILTSLSQQDIEEVGLRGSPADNVLRLAALVEASGLDGVVCSPKESAIIRAQAADGFALVTPGVRPTSAALDDQKRVMTPGDAMRAGSTYLVAGRPVTAATDPIAALAAINEEVSAALAG